MLIVSRLRGGSRCFPGLPSDDPKTPIAAVAASSPMLTRSTGGHVLVPAPNLWLSEKFLMDLARDPETCRLYLARDDTGSRML